MADKKEPQSFALILEDADDGRINQALSAQFGELVRFVTDKANLHATEWFAELTLKIKIKAAPNGKVELVFANPKTTRKEEGMPTARMYHDPNTGLLTREPQKQVKFPGFDNEGRQTPARSASAPGRGGSDKDKN